MNLMDLVSWFASHELSQILSSQLDLQFIRTLILLAIVSCRITKTLSQFFLILPTNQSQITHKSSLGQQA